MGEIIVKQMTVEQWEKLDDGKRPAHIAVQLGDNLWAVSPDGYGAIFYDSLSELEEDYYDLARKV